MVWIYPLKGSHRWSLTSFSWLTASLGSYQRAQCQWPSTCHWQALQLLPPFTVGLKSIASWSSFIGCVPRQRDSWFGQQKWGFYLELSLLNWDPKRNCNVDILFSIMTTKIIVITKSICTIDCFYKGNLGRERSVSVYRLLFIFRWSQNRNLSRQELEAVTMEESCLLTCSPFYLQLAIF